MLAGGGITWAGKAKAGHSKDFIKQDYYKKIWLYY
jgi:hypothetical protein